MALITCPECDQPLSTTAPMCPHCGYLQEPERARGSVQPETRRRKFIDHLLIGCLFVGLVIAALSLYAMVSVYLK